MSITPNIDALLELDDAELLRRKGDDSMAADVAKDIVSSVCREGAESTPESIAEVSVAIDLTVLQGAVAALLVAADPETRKDARGRMAAHLRVLLKSTRAPAHTMADGPSEGSDG